MGWRFRKKIGPLNITKNGISSISLGRRGFTVNINEKGTRTTFGLPGTGLSYQTKRVPHNGGGGFPAFMTALGVLALLSIVILLAAH